MSKTTTRFIAMVFCCIIIAAAGNALMAFAGAFIVADFFSGYRSAAPAPAPPVSR